MRLGERREAIANPWFGLVGNLYPAIAYVYALTLLAGLPAHSALPPKADIAAETGVGLLGTVAAGTSSSSNPSDWGAEAYSVCAPPLVQVAQNCSRASAARRIASELPKLDAEVAGSLKDICDRNCWRSGWSDRIARSRNRGCL
jgi:hypothetical protein